MSAGRCVCRDRDCFVSHTECVCGCPKAAALLATRVQWLADQRGEEFRSDYSGRFMNGDRCVGIVTDSPTSLIEEAAGLGLRGARQDGMGLHYIVYWPKLSVAEKTS